ncbi:MAG: hypothetical protein HY717_20305 [Planctomycetes bacterium]|nr:hypothetical protein [Planctomycetota bacterium]
MRDPLSALITTAALILAGWLIQEQAHAQIEILADFKCSAVVEGLLTEVDFEDLPGETSSCPSLEVGGVIFTDPACVRIGFCSSPTCFPDPDNALGGEGNNVLVLNPGGTIDLPPGTKSAVLDIQGIGSNPFTLRVSDPAGNSIKAGGEGIPYGVVYMAFTASLGISRLEIQSVEGTGGPIGLARIFLGPTVIRPPLPPCEDENAPKLDNLRPKDAGTIRFFPEFGILEQAPVGNDVQSTYFKTTDENREFRRGFIEFAIPDFEGQLQGGTLILGDDGGGGNSRPPDVHELSYYPADLLVNVDDFDAPATLLATFESHGDSPNEFFSFDITAVILEFRGKDLGFRIKLELDPDFSDFGSFGAGFGSLAHNYPRIEIKTDKALKKALKTFVRGDADGNGKMDLSDAMVTLRYLFLGESENLKCEKSADVDDSGALEITDPIFLLLHLFLGGFPPVKPFPVCGLDTTGDPLTCKLFSTCG